MENIRCTIAYDGGRYDGWQRQGNTNNTIQGRLEQMFEKLLGEPVEIHGAGRTDAGVHARGQVFHFHTNCVAEPAKLLEEANAHLPQDMAILSVEKAPERFHSRLNAVKKWYRYCIDNAVTADVFSRKYSYRVMQELDVLAMKQAARLLVGTCDYKSFCSNRRMKKSTVRTVYEIGIQYADEVEAAKQKRGMLYLDFYGNGFLYNMVRIMAGTLIEVGLGKRSPEEMTSILRAKNREAAGMTAPAQGLFLMEVGYDE